MRSAHTQIVAAAFAAVAFAAAAAPAQAIRSYEYTRCANVGDAGIVEVTGASCAEAESVAAQLVAAPAASSRSILSAAGWNPLRAQSTSDEDQYDLIALHKGAALRIRQPGGAPNLDGWEAGRELIFARSKLVGGRPIPSGTVVCSASWLVRIPSGRLGGLSAAHCGGLTSKRKVRRNNVALRRAPQDGIVLGTVRRILSRSKPLDALLVPVPGGIDRSRIPVVDRGVSRPPWTVAGPARPTAGRAVCFSGRTSGIDQCGHIRGTQARGDERRLSRSVGVRVRCTSITAREGDSGGPVFTAPRSDGSIRAVGITTLVVGPLRLMCFTPLRPVLKGLRAKLAVAPR
ncbi:MAG: hypothetical protein ACR2LK_05510 [Solirubrobacteraceae bacterium]